MRSYVLSGGLALLVVVQFTRACFPVDDVFKHSTLWSQDVKKPWRRLYVIGDKSDDLIELEKQSAKGHKQVEIRCLRSFPHHKYLVKFESSGKPRKFGCLQFTPLSSQVVRLASSRPNKNLMKVNCLEEKFKEDVEVMIAYHNILPEACPLSGGFQMLLHEGMTVRAHCLDTVKTYNPKLEFSCDGEHVIADFGKDCAPTLPTPGQKTYQLTFAFLQCVASWDEAGGEVKAVLLQMKNDPSSFWCLHYKNVPGNGDELLTIHLAFDGKCPRLPFTNENKLPGDNSMFGTIAKYVPISDKRCYDSTYIKKCRVTEARCYETRDCPLDCHRCNRKVAKRDCGFIDTVGHWVSIDANHAVAVDVKSQGFRVTEYGIFSCWGPAEYKPNVNIYSVVRNDPYSACIPFYACALVESPAIGIMNFNLRPAERDGETGEPLSCSENPNGMGSILPSENQAVVTLINHHDLPRAPCNIPRDILFPTRLEGCKFSLKECTGICDTLQADFDAASCGNDTRFEIEQEHICHASYRLTDGIRALITSSALNERYLCWMYTSQRLFITVTENCNSAGANRIFKDEQALTKYDPFLAISLPQESKVVSGNNNNGVQSHHVQSKWTYFLSVAIFLIVMMS